MTRADRAESLFRLGYNCSQAVLLSFSDIICDSEQNLAHISFLLGGGVSRLREVCGAVSGMGMAAGMIFPASVPCTGEEKAENYKMMQELAFEFKKRNGSYICRELLGIESPGAQAPSPESRTAQYYKKRPCIALIRSAVDILEEYISEQN